MKVPVSGGAGLDPTDEESEFKPAGGNIGAGFEKLLWPRPVRPGDELRVESEVLGVRQSRSCPDQGLIKVRTTTLNQDDEAVQVITGNVWAAPLEIGELACAPINSPSSPRSSPSPSIATSQRRRFTSAFRRRP